MTVIRRVMVTGIGMVSCHGLGAAAAWSCGGSAARLGAEHQEELAYPYASAAHLEESRYFNKAFFRRRDRFTFFVIEAVHQALVDAALRWPLPEVGLCVESTFAASNSLIQHVRSLVDGPTNVNPAVFANVAPNAAQGQACIEFGFKGPVSTLSGGGAVDYAARLLRFGRAGVVLAGGADERVDPLMRAFLSTGLTSNDVEALGIPYSQTSRGALFSEGSCFVVLEDEAMALERGAPICAELVDSFVCSEGSGARDFKAADQAANATRFALNEILERNRIKPGDIELIFSYANGVQPFDQAELHALTSALCDQSDAWLFPTKCLQGESCGAAAAFSLGLAAHSIRTGMTPHLKAGEISGAPWRTPTRPEPLRGGYVLVLNWDVPGNVGAYLLRPYAA